MYAVPCQISVETLMACGMGVCLGCAVEDKTDSRKYMHVCADGPVFDVKVLKTPEC
jgi:dihydroorotate dehydrogenase electron transfer subunit